MQQTRTTPQEIRGQAGSLNKYTARKNDRMEETQRLLTTLKET